jgi:hypothetical protein
MKWDGSTARTAVHGLLGMKYRPQEKANATADSMENNFTPHNLCDENRERRVQVSVQALLENVENTPLEN